MEDGGKMQGHVEVDETFIGGKARFMHKNKRSKLDKMGWNNKVIVGGFLERGGKVRTQVIENRERKTLLRWWKTMLNTALFSRPTIAMPIGDWTNNTSIKLSITPNAT
jgi:hypothetical protein